MKFRVQPVRLVVIAIATSFLTVSCTSAKVSQCVDTIKVVNQTVTETKTITNSGTKGDLQTIEKLVEIFDKAAKDLEAVKVDDEKLKVYKEQFLSMYKGATEINKQLVTSMKEKKLTKVNEGLRKSNSIFSPERDLVAGINQYCKEPEK